MSDKYLEVLQCHKEDTEQHKASVELEIKYLEAQLAIQRGRLKLAEVSASLATQRLYEYMADEADNTESKDLKVDKGGDMLSFE